MKNHYSIIIPINARPYPSQKEITAAQILAQHFKTDISFVKRGNYKTPDFLINGQYWELKSPTGKRNFKLLNKLKNCWSLKKTAQSLNFIAKYCIIKASKVRQAAL